MTYPHLVNRFFNNLDSDAFFLEFLEYHVAKTDEDCRKHLSTTLNTWGVSESDIECLDRVLFQFVLNQDDWKSFSRFREVLSIISGLTSTGNKPFRLEALNGAGERDQTPSGLYWLLVRIFEMGIFDLNEVSDSGLTYNSYRGLVRSHKTHPTIQLRPFKYAVLKIPDRHCLWCGRSDTDPRGKKFSAKNLYCHTTQCDSLGGRGGHDPEGCCFLKHCRRKEVFRNRLEGWTEALTEKYESIYMDLSMEELNRCCLLPDVFN